MHIPSQVELIAKIEGFCRCHDMAESRFGREAVNNPAFISGLRDGKSPTLETLNKLSAFMTETDERVALRQKLDAPLDPPPGPDAAGEDHQLPFGPAPVRPTGGSSPTSSPTSAPRPPSEESGSSPISSCSVEDAISMSSPSTPTVTGGAA